MRISEESVCSIHRFFQPNGYDYLGPHPFTKVSKMFRDLGQNHPIEFDSFEHFDRCRKPRAPRYLNSYACAAAGSQVVESRSTLYVKKPVRRAAPGFPRIYYPCCKKSEGGVSLADSLSSKSPKL